MTARTFSLGRDGEAQWDTLRAAYVLSRGSGNVELVASDSRDVRAEVRRRLEAMSSEMKVIVPSEGVVDAIHACAKAGLGHETVPVAWIEAGLGDDRADGNEQWLEALAVLNQARDTLQMHGPCHVILAGRRALQATVTQRAPDLASFLNSALLLGDTLDALASDPGVLTWMHLSDLHVGREDWQRDEVLGALVRDLPGLLEARDLHPDVLMVTGDIAAKGAKTDYEGAFTLLQGITEVLGIDRQQHVYMVAGNHDVDRGAIGRTVARHHDALALLNADELRDDVGALLDDPDDFRMYGKRLMEWCAFTERFVGRARSVSFERPWRSDVVEVAGIRLGVLSLCTAWASGSEADNGRLLLGERQLAQMVSEVGDGGAQLVVCLMHHPVDWLHPSERIAIRGRIERDVDVLLHGHLHVSHSAVQQSGGAQHVTIGAGAGYAGLANDRYHGFSIGQLNPAAKTLTVHHFTWSTAASKWHIDPGAPGADDEGRVVLAMPLPTLGPGAPAIGGAAVLGSRLRQAAAHVYDSVDFAGLGAGGPPRHVTLANLFVPLRLSAQRRGSSERVPGGATHAAAEVHGASMTMTVQTLENKLFSSDLTSAAAARVVVLGGPGSGKSTLCRYFATAAARREGGPVPLLLTVRDWVAEGQREGLLQMAAREATQRLSVRTDAEALEQLCSDGNVLLIVDGIDEAPDAETRRKLRDRMCGLASRFPSVAILVTSRVTGYDDVPLNDDTFVRLTLEPFDDEDLESFIRRWYDVAERNDPSARLRKRADLSVALGRERRAKELARNPLLATLIAMAHFTHGRLPGDRAKLYGQIVELLLITWPADRGRRFAMLDGVTQMPMLERVALAMQEQSEGGARTAHVVVDMPVLVELLAGQLREREGECGEHQILDLARRWATWLVRDAGLLQEHSAGRVGFLHLSLMEYMAGRALLDQSRTEGYGAVAAMVEARLQDSRWEETLLLMLGSENQNRALGEAVVDRLLGSEMALRPRPEIFSLQLLREDVDLSVGFRDRILERINQEILQWHGGTRNGLRHLVDDVVSLGRVHRQGTLAWFREHVTRDTGDALASTLAWCPPSALSDEDAHEIVAGRADVDVAVLTLLNFGVGQRWGRLGYRLASTDALKAWATTSPVETILQRCVAPACSDTDRASENFGSWVVPLLRRAGWIAETIVSAAKRLCDEPRGSQHNEDRGVPQAVVWSSGSSQAIARVRPALSGSPGRIDPFLAHEVWQDGVTSISDQKNCAVFLTSGSRSWVRSARVWHAFSRRDGFAGLFDPSSHRTFARDFLVVDLDLREEFVERLSVRAASAPVASAASTVRAGGQLCTLAEAHAGIMVSAAHDWKIGALLGQLRVENLWLCIVYFDSVGQRHDESSPERDALVLTLGLVQYQTTWQWPASPHWRTWFTPTPPKHWLPAHLWHLIRSIQEPSDVGHRERADACLDRSDSPRMRDALREHTLTPTPPELLALFSGDSMSDVGG